jgi:hypothetical protein
MPVKPIHLSYQIEDQIIIVVEVSAIKQDKDMDIKETLVIIIIIQALGAKTSNSMGTRINNMVPSSNIMKIIIIHSLSQDRTILMNNTTSTLDMTTFSKNMTILIKIIIITTSTPLSSTMLIQWIQMIMIKDNRK